jgi:hypothetical protein
MNAMIMAMVLAWGQGAPAPAEPFFDRALSPCGGHAERTPAVASFFELSPGQIIVEFQPDFALTACLADALRGRGGLLVAVDGGDGVEQVVRRVQVQKAMKRDAARYAAAALVALKPGKAVPAEHALRADRVLLAGGAADLMRDPKRAVGLLRALGGLARPNGLLGIVDVPGADPARVERLIALVGEGGWRLVARTSTGSDGVLLLKFRKG